VLTPTFGVVGGCGAGGGAVRSLWWTFLARGERGVCGWEEDAVDGGGGMMNRDSKWVVVR